MGICSSKAVTEEKTVERKAPVKGGEKKERLLRELEEDFKIFDRDGSGKISSDELHRAFRQRGLHLTKEEIKEVIDTVDKNKDREINFEEYCKLIAKLDDQASASQSTLFDKLSKEMQAELEELEREAEVDLKTILASPTSEGQKIVIGPIVGKVEQTTARVLIETVGSCEITLTLKEGEGKEQTFKQSFIGGIPGVFKCSGLKAGARYTGKLSGEDNEALELSFRTVDPGRTKFVFAVASCDKGPKARGKTNMFEKLHKEYVANGSIDVLIRHGDQVYADLAFAQGKHVLKNKEIDEKNKDEAILQCYKAIYRKVFATEDVRLLMAHVPTLMLWDDHELRNDWGTFKQDTDRSSVDYRIATQARRAYWEYQRQLWDDIGERSEEAQKVWDSRQHRWNLQLPLESLSLKVVAAKNLAPVDLTGKADPYLVIELLDRHNKVLQTHKSPVLKKTLDPKWNYVLPEVEEKDLRDAFSIRIQVWDQDSISKNDFMGEAIIPLRVGAPVLNKDGKLEDWFPLDVSMTKDLNDTPAKISGEVYVQLSYKRNEKREKEEKVQLTRETESEGSFHVFGNFGVMFVDGRGARSFSAVEGDYRKFIGQQQWVQIEHALSADGVFKDVRALLVVHSMAPVLMSTDDSATVGLIPPQVDKMGFGLHPKEQCNYLHLLDTWAHGDKKKNREFFLVGGDMHFGVVTNIYAKEKKEKRLICRQMITSAISNSPPPKPVYWVLRRLMKGQGQLGYDCQPRIFKFRHQQFLYERNFGLVEMSVNGGDISIHPTLISRKSEVVKSIVSPSEKPAHRDDVFSDEGEEDED